MRSDESEARTPDSTDPAAVFASRGTGDEWIDYIRTLPEPLEAALELRLLSLEELDGERHSTDGPDARELFIEEPSPGARRCVDIAELELLIEALRALS